MIIGAAMMFSSTIIGIKLLPTTVLHHQHTGEIMISILLLQDLLARVFYKKNSLRFNRLLYIAYAAYNFYKSFMGDNQVFMADIKHITHNALRITHNIADLAHNISNYIGLMQPNNPFQ